MNNARIKLLIITISDRIAGAEKSIYDVLRLIDRVKYEPRLVVFKHEKNGELVEKVLELGIPARCLGIQSKFHFLNICQKSPLDSFLMKSRGFLGSGIDTVFSK